MIRELAHKLGDVLACPYCLGSLQSSSDGLVCLDCQTEYPFLNNAQVDLRLKKSKLQTVMFQVGQGFQEALNFDYRPLEMASAPKVDWGDQSCPRRFSEEFRSYVPRATRPGALALDLGCGTMLHRKMVEHAGFRHVGLDYESDQAPILADAHALPFKDETFEFVLSMAVLEHLQYPFVAMQEVTRVLEQGGLLMGGVAFLEPFHGNSFYHHSPLGVYNTLSSSGLRVLKIAPNIHWPALRALCEMHAIPKKTKPLVQLITALSRLRQKLRPWPERVLASVGSFFLIATKED